MYTNWTPKNIGLVTICLGVICGAIYSLLPDPPTERNVNIFITTIPKSGSDHIADSLSELLKYDRKNISTDHFPQERFNFPEINEIYDYDAWMFKQHLSPTRLNEQVFRRYAHKMVVHLRDPRQVILSWVHHLNNDYQPERKLPANYYQLNFTEQIDWNIENTLPEIIAWMQGWIAKADANANKKKGMQILLTTYDELITDERKLYKKILSFYGLPPKIVNSYPLQPKEKAKHFRKAQPNEWRNVFSEQQKQRIAAIVPDDLLQRFNWQK